jgi:riboflavin kinase/FMN adenylyltransferase
LKSSKPIVLTIGVFDGVHLGHQALLRKTLRLARKLKARPEALTFQDHPMHVLHGGPRIPFLLTRQETFGLLRGQGALKVHILRFTKAFSCKSPAAFVQWLFSLGKVKGIVVGENFRFGRDASGDVATLKKLGQRFGFVIGVVPPVKVQGRIVSSSLIRRLLAEGKTLLANCMLSRPYAIEGEVVHGRHVGHQIGFPTANLHAVKQFLPKDGVYACAVKLGSRIYRAAMNLGQRPTFTDDNHHRQAEVHLLHYYGKLYGKKMRVYLLDYLRPEEKFSSSKALIRQIQKDLIRVQKTLIKSMKSVETHGF